VVLPTGGPSSLSAGRCSQAVRRVPVMMCAAPPQGAPYSRLVWCSKTRVSSCVSCLRSVGTGGEQLVLDAGQHSVGQAELLGPGRGDGDGVAAVGRVGGAMDQPTSGQVVERCHHVAAVDAGAAAQCRLAGWPELL